MSILLSAPGSSKPFEPCPEGVHAAVLADIVDLGVVTSRFGSKKNVRWIWITGELDSYGRPYRLFQQFTASLDPKANLHAAVKALLGRVPASLDLESLVGTQAQLVVEHNTAVGSGKIYANVGAILKPSEGQAVAIPESFVRAKDRGAR